MAGRRFAPLLSALASMVVVAGLGLALTNPKDAPTGLAGFTPPAQPASDCCIEPSPATNFPLPALSNAGTHCPMAEVPEYAESLYDPEAGRIELYFSDVAFDAGRTVVIDVHDPACYQRRGTREVVFQTIVMALENEMPFEMACEKLKSAIRAGSIDLEPPVIDLRPARPFAAEVCSG